jgi:5'-3' exonuclease
MGLCTVSFPGHEGDDTIASICQAMVKRDRHITIFSSDKDFCQLLQHGVDILKPRSGSLKYATITESSFQHEFGLSPSQFVDMTALMGDKVPTSL